VYAERDVPAVVTVNDAWPASYMREQRRGVAGLVDGGPLARHTWRGVDVRRAVYLSDAIRCVVRGGGAPLPAGLVRAQGIDLADFHTRPFRAMRAAPELLFAARLHPTKAPEVAIDTLVSLRARGIDARLTMAGATSDRAYEAELVARAAPVAPYVTWLGQVPRAQMGEVYRRADAFLYPLAWEEEAQGLTYMEAMACGVPVIAYPRGGARELLDAHDVAARPAACEGTAFAATFVALASDPDRQRALAGNAAAFLREHASLDRYVDVLEAELEAARRENATSPYPVKETA
jgi:glycosyltransferase involved in cell wall biosynthesis